MAEPPQPSPALAAQAQPASPASVFLVFLEIGSVLFGSGYVLLAFRQAEFVERRGWLNSQQLLDAVAAGQVTPGPVFSTATFVGYVLAGNAGAALCGARRSTRPG
ncbi:MAG: chromate transporter [Pirellulales bacterium]